MNVHFSEIILLIHRVHSLALFYVQRSCTNGACAKKINISMGLVNRVSQPVAAADASFITTAGKPRVA